MAKIILLCGKICSGKSTYAASIKTDTTVYFVDDNMKRIFDAEFEEPSAEEVDILAGRSKD